MGGLFQELGDASGLVTVDAAESKSLTSRYTNTRDRHACPGFDVVLNHLFRIHPVHVVGTENHDVLGVLVVNEIERLQDCVGAAGVPARPEPLLGRDRSDVLTREPGQSPRLRNMAVE